MTDFSNFLPIFARTEDDIREDWDIRANAGLTPDDPDWVDTRQGSPYWINSQPMVIEFASAYDRMNEAIAAGILATSWGDKLDLHAESYGEERIEATKAAGVVTFTGDDGTLIGTGTRISPVQVDPDIEPPFFQTTQSGTISGGNVDLAVEAIEPGDDGNISAGAIELLQTGIVGVDTVTNDDSFSGGGEVESDDDLKKRLQLIFLGKGSGTVADYTREVLRWPGVGRVRIIPHDDGPGTVTVIVLDDNGDPVGGTIVPDLQAHLDPDPGLGHGWAPINHIVTVSTPTATPIYISGTPVFEDGFSLDGAGGTVAMNTILEETVSDYINQLEAGEDVVYNHVLAEFFREEGIVNVGSLKVDDIDPPVGTTDVVIDNDHVAQFGGIELS